MKDKIAGISEELRSKNLPEVLRWGADHFHGSIAFSSSLSIEDQIIIDSLARSQIDIPVFTLDTGRLFPQFHDLLARTEAKYGIRIRVFYPDAASLESMVSKHGINLFRQSVELRRLCCRVRKIEPLNRALDGLDAWVCGLRREQNVTRKKLSILEWDEIHKRLKINPLANWDEAQMRAYVSEHKVPYNPLHDQGFPSIGCACCTRAIKPGEDLRAGRWWWESPDHKECGLHAGQCSINRR